MSTQRAITDRTKNLDNYKLATEVTRHASVAARFLSRAERAEAAGDQVHGEQWRYAAGRAEDHFLAEVDECRRRLADETDGDLASWLDLYAAMKLVAEPGEG